MGEDLSAPGGFNTSRGMTVIGVTITERQLRAGLSAMNDTPLFTHGDVRNRLARAGVPVCAKRPGGMFTYDTDNPASRCADRLLQAEKKAGRVRFIGNGYWERLAQPPATQPPEHP